MHPFEIILPPEAGDLAPDVQLVQLATGNTIALSSLRGKLVLLEFWTSWCGPCQPAMEETNRLVVQNKAAWKDRACFLSVSIDARADQAKQHAVERGWNGLEHCWSGPGGDNGFDSPAARAFAVWGVPQAFLIGPDRRIVSRGHPMDKRGGQDLKSRLEAALSR